MPNDSRRPSDTEIVERILGGEVNAFEILLLRFQEQVLKIVNRRLPRDEVEETAHKVFIRVYEALPSYRGEADFERWISGIAVRTCHDYWRKAYRSRELAMSSLTEIHREWLRRAVKDGAEQSFARRNSQREARELLRWALGKLSAADRSALELVYLEGWSTKEAARLLGWSVSTLKVRAFRARRKLRKLMEEFLAEGQGPE